MKFVHTIVTAVVFAVVVSSSATPVRSNLASDGIDNGETATYTAADYIQDGLVALWDGIENVDWGVHNENASSWIDLVGGIPLVYSGFWEWNCYNLNGSYQRVPCPSELSDIVSSGTLTMEFVFLARWEDRFGGYIGFNNCRLNIAAYGSGDTQNQSLHFQGFNTFAYSICTEIYGSNPLTIVFATVSVDGGKLVIPRCLTITDGIEVLTIREPRAVTPISTESTEFGICSRKMYAIRIYNRVLTEEEKEKNHTIDRVRFGL